MLERYTLATLAREFAFIALAVVFVLPVLFLINLSLKTPAQTAESPLSLSTDPAWENYSQAWNSAGSGLGPAMVTSVVITAASVVGLLVLGTAFSYVLARSTSKMGTIGYALVVLSLVLPAQLGTVPLYAAMRDMGLVGQPIGVIIVYIGQMMPFTVFLIAGFIRKLPIAYEQAAEVDGASRTRILVWVVIPLIRPILATVAVLNGLVIWNDFFLPLLWFGGTESQTLPVALNSFVGASGFDTMWNVVFAGIVIVVTPVLVFYIVAQKYLMSGFGSGVRG